MSHICPKCKRVACEAVERVPLSSSDPKADVIKAIRAIRALPESTSEKQTERMARAMFPILRDIVVRTFERLGLWNGGILEFNEMPKDQREALYEAARAAQKVSQHETGKVREALRKLRPLLALRPPKPGALDRAEDLIDEALRDEDEHAAGEVDRG